KRDALACHAQCSHFCPHLCGGRSNLVGSCDQWRQGKTKRFLDFSSPALSRIALSVGAVAPQDQPGFHQGCKMTAQCRAGHAMRSQRKLLVGWENDKTGLFREFCVGVERSEEHTSELHHVKISYAVFCSKKKNL